MPTPNILWCGGEDCDFQNQMGSGITVDTGSHHRSGFSRNSLRCSVGNSTATIRGPSFPGGAVTSAWLHFICQSGFGWNNNTIIAGLALTTPNNGSGLYLTVNNSGGSKLALAKWDGTTLTQLAAGSSSQSTNVNIQVDINIQNYGATATVNVYLNGAVSPEITYSGNTTVSGVSNLDCVSFSGGDITCSEFIVADGDTRALGLATLAPNANGTTNNWTTGTYASINPNAINTANVIAVNTTGQDFQANLNDLPSGSFAVLAVKIVALAEVPGGSTPTGVKLGVNSGGTVNVGSSNTPGAVWTQYERLMSTNPVTAAAWTTSDINALQLDLQSA